MRDTTPKLKHAFHTLWHSVGRQLRAMGSWANESRIPFPSIRGYDFRHEGICAFWFLIV